MYEPPPEPPLQPTLTAPRKFQDRTWLHLTLLVLTIASTTLVGGLWYSATILLILGAHELGHYLACRYYQVDASLPFFIPMPIVLTGTLGAFIKIREPIPTKRMLFDIGIAGPLAGFLFAVPALFIGVAMSQVVRVSAELEGFSLGEPLLFQAVTWVIWGTVPEGYVLNMHPTAFAAWFGLLATALNLFPVGQLDGGHISYAVLGRRSTTVTVASICAAIGLSYFSTSWLVWTFLLVAMTLVMGPHHPRTLDEDIPLDLPRIWLAVVALVILVLCFTSNPIEPTEWLGR
ncbi:MAG TPA: site-2 protease family protein [Vicinamibacterales bacterium]|nr:site-2 protease family protein [Vicinamibacterales bacterium]